MSVAEAPHRLNQAFQLSDEVLSITKEHHLMGYIRERLYEYSHESPARFELAIEAYQIDGTQPTEEQTRRDLIATSIKLQIQGDSTEGRSSISLVCRVTWRKRRSRMKPYRCNIVTPDGASKPLEHFLKIAFPIIDAPLRQDTMWSWWMSNGKNFKWAALPTELKERVIEFCMHQTHTHGIYDERVARFNQRYKNSFKPLRHGPYEIVQRLGDWYQLLYVSQQVRAIALRLCITGGSGIVYSEGLCIVESSSNSLSERLDRLGDYYQMVEPHSIPTTPKEVALSKCYSRFPRIYPELRQYATHRHGIQKISLDMTFLSFMNFFEVKVGHFEQFQNPRSPTYHALERLPNLNEIIINLPLRPRSGWRNITYYGSPQLYHDESPCPRILHRVIYERAAEVLASYDNVTVRNFIDENEQQRFLSGRLKAMKALKFTKVELEELYADDGGGVELPEGVGHEVRLPEKNPRKVWGGSYPGFLPDPFFPPVCQCDEPCILSLASS
ncbi:hypothetical protein OPT61_g7237 [Boeremia exigua]|uniref:Uncharacterized protein n=1 Tax=Boeremia exigua TaxID=749465 RepID=A0ACC2I4R0_9PLEO|nr:hypothetical protein OPT61_g7237 [Boeremia exigua]